MQTQSEKVFDESDILPIVQPSLDLKIDPDGVDTKIADERVSVDAKLALKPDITNVLTKDNATAYTPTEDYHPATKYHAENVDKYTRAEVDNGIAALASTRLSTVASAVVLSGQVALENAVITKNYEEVTYTGTGAALDITTVLNTCDFTVAGNGSGYWLDRATFEVKDDAGNVVTNGETDWSMYNSTSGETPRGLCRTNLKNRTSALSSIVVDGLRGAGKNIYTDLTNAELDYIETVKAFNSNGITIGTSNNVSELDSLFVLYQDHFCTHIKWGVTNHGKKYVEAYNPVTKEYIEAYEGSGLDGHQLPHSLGVAVDYIDVKNITTANNWNSGIADSGYCLNLDNAFSTIGWTFSDTSVLLSTTSSGLNSVDTFIMYGKAKSKTWTIVEYIGTGIGIAGNIISTKDVFGVDRKVARLIGKAVSAVGNWEVYDNKRGIAPSDDLIWLNLPNEENVGTDRITWHETGFEPVQNLNEYGVKYIALVEFDTNSDGGGSYYPMPVDDSNLLLTDVVFSYTDGKDGNGFARKTETVALGSVDFAGVTDGLKWVAKEYGGGYQYRDLKPSYGIYNKQFADDNRDVFDIESGKWISTTGEELVTNGTFDVDTSGWTASESLGSTASILSTSNGTMKVTNSGTTWGSAYQIIAVVPGVKNTLSVGVTKGTSADAFIKVGYQSELPNTNSLVNFSTASSGTYTFDFIPNKDTVVVFVGNRNEDSTDNYFDNISVFKKQATLDTPLATPISFNKNPIYVASETPQYIDYNDELIVNQMDSLDVKGKISMSSPIYTDKPIFVGEPDGVHIKAAGIIFNWIPAIDSHNAYSNGIWTCPKDGWYNINMREWHAHTDTTLTKVYSDMFINGEAVSRQYSYGTSYGYYNALSPHLTVFLKKGDTLYTKSISASSTHYIYFGWQHTNISIEYIGETK